MHGILKRIAAIALTISITLSLVGSITQYTLASAWNTLGTNAALGSPLLNDNFSADDWNKWEMVVWGIFLSNFTTPFIDDYNSAFNLDTSYGSKGSGVKALQFGTGRDPANNKVIQDLLNYAMNQQIQGATKQIYVSYTGIKSGDIVATPSFNTASTLTPTTTTTPTTEGETPTVDESTLGTVTTQTVRPATVKDLFFMQDGDTSQYIETWAYSSDGNTWPSSEIMLEVDNYVDFVGIKNGSIPTFAVRTNAGGYETVLDYTDGYDVGILPLVLTRGLGGDFKDEFKDIVDDVITNADNYILTLDCFGNICTNINGSLRVIIPAASNKHLTSTPSINLVNSLIFNANVNTASEGSIKLNAGQDIGGFLDSILAEKWQSGLPAVTNSSSRIPAGSPLIFYDTDTIVWQKAMASGDSKYNVDVGELYETLFNLDITNELSQQYSFKVEPANIYSMDFKDMTNKDVIENTFIINGLAVNYFNAQPSAKVLTSIKTSNDESLNIFGDAYVVPVQMYESQKDITIKMPWESDSKYNLAAIHREFVDYTYDAYKSNIQTTTGLVQSSHVRKAFAEADTVDELYEKLLIADNEVAGGGKASTLFTSFINRNTEFYKVEDLDKVKNIVYEEDSGWSTLIVRSGYGVMLENYNIKGDSGFKLRDHIDDHVSGGADSDAGTFMDYDQSPFGRSIKVYSTSETMRSIANILGVREGTEFAQWSVWIYLTYLDWYGITGNSLSQIAGDQNTSNLNERIFDGTSDILNIDINSVTELMTDEQKEQSILDWTYLMLNPTEGREYRSNIIISGISDWIYDTYQKIVYGGASSYYDTGTGVTSRNSTGFLTISPYSENFLTSWLIDNYAYYAVIVMGVFIILIIVLGLLRKRKISWFLITIIVMVNMLLILPSTGEVAPLVANNFVQNMFSDKMSYWAISESVTNATMESDYVSGKTLSSGYLSSLTADEQQQVIKMVKNLNVLYLDRSISIKQDISKKVTSEAITDYEELQQLRSARWMLPMLMRQFTADDNSANYVYIPLGDKFDDLSNMYWFYKPDDALYASTVTSTQTESGGADIPSYSSGSYGFNQLGNRYSFYASYYDHTSGYETAGSNYKQKSYDSDVATDDSARVHNYIYFLDDASGSYSGDGDGLISVEYASPNSFNTFDEWAKDYASKLVESGVDTKLATLTANIEKNADTYDRFDRGTMKNIFAYLWATENPLHYFYAGVKDSFPIESSLGSIIGDIQGTYIETDTGEEHRKSFMHDGETGNIRDILDLEEMFTNMIPYLYSIQLLAEGYNDVPGLLEGKKIDTYTLYDGIDQSWLYRSNWVTKIMENKEYHKSATIGLADGTKVTVHNMLMPECYETAGRPMVFSEAQMKYLGLDESQLSLIELKCVEVNREACRQWTLLLNYASTPGMTKEVIVRQMALDALIIFNKEFSPTGVLNGAYVMYPTGLDLRSISFDSVMKMLMLNITKDTSYIYGDTMQTIVEDSDIFTALLLLATAFICVYIIPLVRNILMALIFYLGLWAILWNILKSNKTKAKIACGYFVSNMLFLVMTFAYFLAFRAIMVMTATDEVLTISQQVEINTGNPVWCLIFVLVISAFYLVGMYKMIQTCVANYRDMGFEMYAGIAETAAGSISNTIEKLGSKINSDFGIGYGGSKHGLSAGGKNGGAPGNPSGFGYSGGSSESESASSRKDRQHSSYRKTSEDAFERSSYLDKSQSSLDTGDKDSRSIDSKIKSGQRKAKVTDNQDTDTTHNTTNKSNINLEELTDVKSVERKLKEQHRIIEYSEKRVSELKHEATVANKEGRSILAQGYVDDASDLKARADVAKTNIKKLEQKRDELIQRNESVVADNQRKIDEL